MNNLINEFFKEGATVCYAANPTVLRDVAEIIDSHFVGDIVEYCSMSRDNFLSFAYECQQKINNLNIQERFIESELPFLKEIMHGENICYQTVCFLRVVRPISMTGEEEAADFHRETFYSDNPETTRHAVNIWIPIKNVDERNTLQYIKGSHLIPDQEIIAEEIGLGVEKYSTGHKMGFFWNQKKPKSGVNMEEPSRFRFPLGLGSYAIFSSMTIHGNAQNHSDELRYVIGFSVIPKSKITHNKKSYASQDDYFKEYPTP